MLSVMMCLKENVYLINGETMFHSAFKKDTEQVVCFILLLEVEGLIQIIVEFWAERFSYVSITIQTSF